MYLEVSNFKEFFNELNDFIFIYDTRGNILDFNNTVSEELGYTIEDLSEKSVLLLHPSEYRDSVSEIVDKIIAGEMDSCSFPILSKNNSYVPVQTKVFPGKWRGADVFIGVSRNLSKYVISEEKFSKVFNNDLLIVTISQVETGIYINVNQTFLNVLGFSKNEVIGKTARDLNILSDPSFREKFSSKLKNNQPVRNEYVVIQAKGGKPVHVFYSCDIVHIDGQKYLLSTAVDITSLKQKEAQIKKNYERQKLLAEISQVFLSLDNFQEKVNFVLKRLGTHTRVSRVYIFENSEDGAFCSNTFEWCNEGIEPQIDKLQNVPYEILPSWNLLLQANGKILSNNIKELPADLRDILEPQDIKSILVFPLQVKNSYFGFIGFDECESDKKFDDEEVDLLSTIAGIISNSFERMMYQKELLESELRQKLALENTDAGLWDWNLQTGKFSFNDAWYRILGYDKEDTPNSEFDWESFLHKDDVKEVQKSINNHISGALPSFEATCRIRMKSGEWKWVLKKGKIVEYDSQNNPVRAIGTIIDIEKIKTLEHELRSVNSTKDKLFSIIAHDLRSPIGGMLQISDILSEMVFDDKKYDAESFKKFLRSQKELSVTTFQLLDNLLNWARVNMENIKYSPNIINLNNIIEDNILILNYRAQIKQINFVKGFNTTFYAFADQDMVQLIFRNLLSNALKFSKDNGMVMITMEKKDRFVEIAISDTGVGISTENIKKILSNDEFFSTPGTANEKGSGLGLKLCRSFVLQNKGQFKIESVPNKGTTVTFTLPTKN